MYLILRYGKTLIHALVLLLLYSPLLFSQTNALRFENLNVEDGLSQRFVLEVVIDCQGFLWVATEDGLNKYDGYEFKVFRNDPKDPSSIGGDILRQALESHADGGHKLWVCTVGGGLACMDLTTELFVNYQHDPDDSTSISNNSVWIVEETFFNEIPEIWVGVIGPGLDRLDPRTGKFKHYDFPSMVTDLFYDSKGVLWVGTSSFGLGRYNPERDDFTFYQNDPENPKSLASRGTYDMTEDQDGNLWIGTIGPLDKMILGESAEDEPYFMHYENDPNDPNTFSGPYVEYLFEDSQGKLWVSTFGGGQDLFDREKEVFSHFKHDPDNPHSIGANSILSVAEDHSGVLWFGHQNGISKWDKQKAPYTRYENSPLGPTGLKGMWITSIISTIENEQEILWLATVGKGFCRLNRASGELKWYTHDPKESNSVADNTVLGIMNPQEGVLLLVTWGGLSKFNIEQESFETYYLYPNPNSDYHEEVMITGHMGPSGRIWLGVFNHIAEFDLLENRLKSVTTVRAYAVHEAEYEGRQYLWGGSFNYGLVKIDLESGEETWYLNDPSEPTSIADNMIEALYHSSFEGKDVLWVGTMKGLDRFDYETEEFKHYTMADGLPHNHVTCINEDDSGILWITSKIGLTRFDPLEETFKTFWKEDGLPSDGYEFESIYRNKEGEIFVGGDGGLVSFFPDSLKKNLLAPNVVLTDFKLFHESVPVRPSGSEEKESGFSIPKHISYLDELDLSYKENVISLEFSALDFRSPGKNRYAYYLEGFEDDWHYVDASNRQVTYTSLDPGKYVFRVKGSNNDGVWNEKGTSIRILITPPWWKTSLAYILYLAVISVILILLYRRQMERIRLKHQLELKELEANRYREVDEIKTRFFTNISHEFRTPLTLILGPIEKLIKKVEDHDSIKQLGVVKRNALRLNRLVSQLLDLSKIEANKHTIRASRHNLIPLLKALVLSFSSLAERKGVTLEFKSDHEELFVYIERESFRKIINNLLGNAFKFTDTGGEIIVQVLTSDSNLEDEMGKVSLVVSDTGIGISEDTLGHIFDRFYQVDGSHTREREGTGIGLALTKELVDLHHGKISVTSAVGMGTSFTVDLQLGQSHFAPDEILDNLDDEELELEADPEAELFREDESNISEMMNEEMASILIVEDNSDVRSYIRSSLEHPFVFFEAVDGLEGLEKAYQYIPDLIISDIMMPRMDGLDLCTQLKQDERTSHIPIVLLTAKADMESKLEGLDVGADAYIVKPFETKELELRILNLIDLRERLQDHFRKELNPLPSQMSNSAVDAKFLTRCFNAILENIKDEDFGVDKLAVELHISRQHLNRKLRALSGETPAHFIRSVRLKRAAQLLLQDPTTILEIAYEVGFRYPSYFSKCFQEQFGVAPKEFIASKTDGSA